MANRSPAPPPTIKSVRDKRRRRPRRPSQRVVSRFRRFCAGTSQRQIAREDRVAPESVCTSIKRCARYIAETMLAPNDIAPAGQLHLADVSTLEALKALRQEAEEKSARAEQQYPGRVTTITKKGEVALERKVLYQDPPRVGWAREKRILCTEIEKLQQALTAAKAAAASPAPSPQAPAPAPASAAGFALAPPLLAADPCDDATHQRWYEMDGGKKTYGKMYANVPFASLPQRAAYWRYQALGLEHGFSRKSRTKFVKILIHMDDLALQAAAIAEAEGAENCGLEIADCRLNEDASAANLQSAIRIPHYLDLLLKLDGKFSARQRARIMAHYDAKRGQFNWRVPAEDLLWLTAKEKEDCGLGEDAAGNPQSAICNPQWLDPLPEPPVVTDALRRECLATPFDKLVVYVRLGGYAGSGRFLKDVPNDQESVVIYELVEEVVRDAAWLAEHGEAGGGNCGLQISDCGLEEKVTEKNTPNPQSQIPNASAANPQSEICNPQFPLTPQLRDALYQQVGKEGVAVVTRTGQIYTGPHLKACGLIQRGILFLRELCHSTPAWQLGE